MLKDHHENSNKTNPPYEENMDKWNNYCGREIAKEIRKEYNPLQVILMINSGTMDDIIARKVIIKMRKGELIINPFKDKRSFQKKINGSSTGFATNSEHIFTQEEIDKMSLEEFEQQEKAIMKQLKEKGIPSNQELKEYRNKQQQSENGHWVTINSRHVFIED